MHKQNNTDIDTAQDIDIVMAMYNLIEYSDNYSKNGIFTRMNQMITYLTLNYLNLKLK